MKKSLVALLAMIILSSTAVYASDTPISDWINSKTSKITQKEKSAAAKAEADRKKRQEKIAKQKAKQAEARKKAAERQAAREKKAREHQQKVEHKKSLLKELFSND